jgi:hypothetical protein
MRARGCWVAALVAATIAASPGRSDGAPDEPVRLRDRVPPELLGTRDPRLVVLPLGNLRRVDAGGVRFRWSRGGSSIDLLDRGAAWTLQEALWLRDSLDRLPDLFIRKAIRGGMHRIVRDAEPTAPWNVLIENHPTITGVAVPVAPWNFVALGDRCFANERKAYRTIVHELAHCAQWDLSAGATLTTGTPGFTEISWTTGAPTIGLRSYSGFVTRYAQKTHMEDFAECCEFYWIDPAELRRANPTKYAFIRDVVFEGLRSPEEARVDIEPKPVPVLPAITRLGDVREDILGHVTVHGERFMAATDGGFNAVRFRGVKALHLPVSRSTLHAWVPAIGAGSAPVTVTTQDGRSDPRAFTATRPWWRFW